VKCFVDREWWGPIAIGVFAAVFVLYAEANEWMYLIIYALIGARLGWYYLFTRRKTQRADWRRPQ
jgi:steroid 5-alpha reductase family enzyme